MFRVSCRHSAARISANIVFLYSDMLQVLPSLDQERNSFMVDPISCCIPRDCISLEGKLFLRRAWKPKTDPLLDTIFVVLSMLSFMDFQRILCTILKLSIFWALNLTKLVLQRRPLSLAQPCSQSMTF